MTFSSLFVVRSCNLVLRRIKTNQALLKVSIKICINIFFFMIIHILILSMEKGGMITNDTAAGAKSCQQAAMFFVVSCQQFLHLSLHLHLYLYLYLYLYQRSSRWEDLPIAIADAIYRSRPSNSGKVNTVQSERYP